MRAFFGKQNTHSFANDSLDSFQKIHFFPFESDRFNSCMFRKSILRWSAKDISLRGSEWTRLTLRNSSSLGGSVPCDANIHIFPMLHVASVKFYDAVLEEVKTLATSEDGAPPLPMYALLEGILSSPQQRMVDAQEFSTIFYDKNLNQQISSTCAGAPTWDPLADRSHIGLGMQATQLYSDEVLREICNKELNLGLDTIVDYNRQKSEANTGGANLLHLQDAYFKPLLATLVGNSMLSADVTEAELMKDLGSENVPLHKLPQQRVKAFREEHLVNYLLHIVTRQSLLKQAEFVEKESPISSVPLCNIAVLWGHYHTDGILEALQQQVKDVNAKGDDDNRARSYCVQNAHLRCSRDFVDRSLNADKALLNSKMFCLRGRFLIFFKYCQFIDRFSS